MQIKAADDPTRDIRALEGLLRRTDLSSGKRREIEDHLRQVRAGHTGEREAAREMELNFGRTRNFMTIHDLRFVVDGFPAQIDHLILNRLGEIWVCETKHFVEGVSVNEHMEWSRYWKGKRIGMASPIEQNRRHILLLSRVFADRRIAGPRRFGVAEMTPDFRSLVLVSNNASIGRPRKAIPGLEQVIKIERLEATVRGAIDASSPRRFARMMGEQGLEAFAREVASIHEPIAFDWVGRFGLPQTSPVSEQTPPPVAVTARALKESPIDERHRCSVCEGPVTRAEVFYSTVKLRARFGGRVVCRTCQTESPEVNRPPA
jgi:hypothetical protein